MIKVDFFVLKGVLKYLGRYHRKLLLVGTICFLFSPVLRAQNVAVKTNTLYWMAAGTMNAEVEFGLSRRTTFALSGLYNPWTFKDDRMMHLGAVQPELKYWFCERFEGHFVGLHVHGAQFFGDLLGFGDKRYDGWLAGAGLSWGYDWILSTHWNMEFEVGYGINHAWYKETDCLPCVKSYVNRQKTFHSPTKIALSFAYLF